MADNALSFASYFLVIKLVHFLPSSFTLLYDLVVRDLRLSDRPLLLADFDLDFLDFLDFERDFPVLD